MDGKESQESQAVTQFTNLLSLSLGFFEERAILLGRLGRHEQALAIYVYVLHDNKMAEE